MAKLKAALSGLHSCIVPGQRTVMALVMHTWVTHDTEPVWGQLLSLRGWERKESEIAVSEVGQEGAKKREAGHGSLPGFLGLYLAEVPGEWLERGGLCVGLSFH